MTDYRIYCNNKMKSVYEKYTIRKRKKKTMLRVVVHTTREWC